MSVSQKVIGLGAIFCLLTIVSCDSKLVPNVPLGEMTLQCTKDCVSVSKAFIKEHAELFDEDIKLRAALKMCREEN